MEVRRRFLDSRCRMGKRGMILLQLRVLISIGIIKERLRLNYRNMDMIYRVIIFR